MRVISGKYRGHKIDGFKIDGTRPTMDRVKESMFAMIQSYIKDSVVLDLFAGSGNLGIEAISNGSKETYFVDKNNLAIKMITNNLLKMHISESYKLLEKDYKKALKDFKEDNIKFDLVFLDPPYRYNFINKILDMLVNFDLLNDKALIICEYDEEEVASKTLTLIKEKKYNDKYVRVYKKEN